MSKIEARLSKIGLVLPSPVKAVANYAPANFAGPLLFVSGQLPLGEDGKLAPEHVGKLSERSTPDAPRSAARLCAINVIAQAKAALGDLDRVRRVVRVGGFFAVEGAFAALPQAMNGASDLFVDVFGEAGRHARTTVGVAYLPFNATAEVEAVFEIAP